MPQFPFPLPNTLPPDVVPDGHSHSVRYLIGGEIRTWTGATNPVLSPIQLRRPDGSCEPIILGQAPALDVPEALAALEAAKRAWNHGRGDWPTARVARRIGAVEKFVERIAPAREDVVRLLMWEIGKTRKDAEGEFDRTLVYVRDTVEALKDLDRAAGRFALEAGTLGQIRRSPLGVVLCMGPFNYPFNETFTTLIPALIMGNAAVVKLPRFGQLLFGPLLPAFAECFPAGVVNVIQGDGKTIIGPLMASGEIDAFAFIGTSGAANAIRKAHPRINRLRSITGLEAKNPAVILPDADLDLAVAECASGALSFNGQRCTALKLMLAHESIADRFVEKLAAKVDSLVAGLPWEAGVALTPLPEPNKPQVLGGFVDDARAKGARVVGSGGWSDGSFYRPAVVYPVARTARLFDQEQFGPVVPVATFRDDAEIAEIIAASHYGQQISLFGNDPQRVACLVDALVNQVSRINLNAQCRRGPDTFPFTGRKDSAEGTLSVSDALRAFSIRALVAATTTEANKQLVGEIVARRYSSFLTTDFIF